MRYIEVRYDDGRLGEVRPITTRRDSVKRGTVRWCEVH